MNQIIRQQVLERDSYQCCICKTVEILEVHHKIPRVRGGTDDLDNLHSLYEDCHDDATLELIRKGMVYGNLESSGGEVEIVVKGYRCLRCDHIWQPRSKSVVTKECASCKSPYWNRPRKQKK